MTVLKMVGANRFMNKKANPNVMVRGDLTEDIKDPNLVKHLLGMIVHDTLKNEHPMFVEHIKEAEPEAPAEVEEAAPVKEKKVPAKKAVRKKATRTRKPA